MVLYIVTTIFMARSAAPFLCEAPSPLNIIFCCFFNSSSINSEELKKQKKIRFSGAGASHQNGAAERNIKTIVTMARTMLMHAARSCPEDTFSTDLCPMEMDYDVWVYNQTPDMQPGLSAIEI